MNYRCVLWIIDVSSELQVCATDYRCLMQITDVCCRLEKCVVDYRWMLRIREGCCGLQMCAAVSDFYIGAGETTSGPPAFMVNSLLIAPSPQFPSF